MKTKRTKRTLSLLLTFVMVLTLIPAMSSTAFAYDPPDVGFDREHPLKCTDFNSFKAAMEDSSIVFVKTPGQAVIPANATVTNGAYINTVGEKVVSGGCFFSTSDDSQATSGDFINVGQNSTLSLEASILFDPGYDGASVITTPHSTSKLFVSGGVGLRGAGEYVSSGTSDGYGIKADYGKVVIYKGTVSGFEDSDIGICCALRVGEANVDIYGGTLITYRIIESLPYSFPTPAVRLAGEAGASKLHVYGNSNANTGIYNGFAWETGGRDSDIDDTVIDSFSNVEYLSDVSIRSLNDRTAAKMLRITRPGENDTHYFPLTVMGIDYYPYSSAQKGTVLDLSAPETSGDKVFDRWECISNIANVDFADPYSSYTTFTMPGEEVEIKAVYKTKIFKPTSGSSPKKIGTTHPINTSLEPSAYPSNNGVLSEENTIILQKQTGITWADVWASSPSEWSYGNINATLPAENTAGRIVYRWHVMDVTGRWQDKMIYVDWEPLTVTYDMQGHGTQVAQTSVNTVGSKIATPQKPTAPGYIFNGWVDENNNNWIFNTNTVTQDITLYADWAEYGFFGNIPNGEGCIGHPITVSLANINHPTTQAYLEENVNGYWDKSHRILLSDSATSYTFSAQDEYTVKTYRIAIQISDSGDDDVYSNQFTVKWRSPIVSFNLRGYGESFTRSVSVGGKVSQPTNPTREGYTFSRWEYQNAPYDFDTPVTQDITLDAVWIEAGFVGTIPNYVGEIKSPVTVSLENVNNPNHNTMKLEEKVDGEWQYEKTLSNAMLDIEDFEIDAEITKVTKTYRINIADMIYSNEFTVSWTDNGLPLEFTDQDSFDIREGTIGYGISGYNLNPVSSNVSGGVSPYAFSKVSGPDWIQVDSSGYVSGTRPSTVSPATTAVFRVTDSVGATDDITINVGAVVATLRVPTITPDVYIFMNSPYIIINGDATATTYYTTDGSNPKTSSTRQTLSYGSALFTITETTTVKAYTLKAGFPDTPVVSATYTKVAVPTAPAASLASGTATSGTVIELSQTTNGTYMYYTITTDGLEPRTPTAETGIAYTYSNRPVITGDIGTVVRIKAIACSSSDESIVSPVAEYTYTVVGVTVSGTVSSFGSDETVKTYVRLYRGHGENIAAEPTYEAEVTGIGIKAYSINSVSAGDYTVVVSKQNHFESEYEITVGGTPVTQNIELLLLGDVDINGNCDALDCMKAELMLNGHYTPPLSAQRYFDVDCNGVYDIMDFQDIMNYAVFN